MRTLRIALLLTSSLSAFACATEPVEQSDSTAESSERGLGKADGLFGSCFDEGEPTCDGPASEGNCWCDDACIDWGDCCTDKADACGGDAPPPGPELCLSDDACGEGQVCDHSECLSGCPDGPEDIACPAVCYGQCVDGEPEPTCGAPEDYVDVDAEELFANPDAYVGQQIALTGAAHLGFPICTQLACSPEAPCCNSCGAGIEMETDFGQLEMSGLGCGGNNCDVMQNCDYDAGQTFTAWGTFDSSFGLVHLDVDGSCAPQTEPVDDCDCEEDEICIPLCPVCAAGTPPELCQCTQTCVEGLDGGPCFSDCMGTCADIGNGACEQMCFEQCAE